MTKPRKSRRITKYEREAKERIGKAHWKILTAVSNGRLVSHGKAVTRAHGNAAITAYSGGTSVERSRDDSGRTSGDTEAHG